MEKKDFTFNQALKQYEMNMNNIKISIDEDFMSDEVIELAKKVTTVYPQKIEIISEYLSNDDGIICFYGNLSNSEIALKLHNPSVSIDKDGGVLSYCEHELDADHIIDLEFGGVLETFYYVSIDG